MEIKNIKLKSKNELIKICKNKNIKGYSKLNKDELIKHIKTYNKKGSGKNIWGPRSWWITFKHKYISSSKNFTEYDELLNIINIYYKIKYKNMKFNDINLNMIRNTYGKIDNWDVSQIIDMNNLFYEFKDFNENLSKWDVSNVTNMENMFNGCRNFKGDISSWNVSNVTNMKGMFCNCTNFNSNISSWNVSNVENMENMFYNCWRFNNNISSWNVSNVITMAKMFSDCIEFDQPLHDWDVTKVTNMENMFAYCRNFNQNLNSWNVSNVKNMENMFNGCGKFKGDVSSWNVIKVTNMLKMFYNCEKFNKPLNSWNVSNVEDMESMFHGCKEFNQPLDSWNVSNVTNMLEMFSECKKFDKPLNNWKVHNVTIMRDMFYKCIEFNQPLDRWNVSMVVTTAGMFANCKKFNQPLDSWNVTNVKYMEFMFYSCQEFNQPLDSWNVGNVTNMKSMFYECKEFNQNLNSWNVSNVDIDIGNFKEMFHQAMKMEPINVRRWGIDIRPLFDRRVNTGVIEGRVNIIQQPNENQLISETVNIISSNKILFNKNMLSSNNNTCNTKLYDMLLKINLDDLLQKKFTFENERGIDQGGLSRTVYDIFFRTYLNKFFILNDDHFYILKNLKDLEEFRKATMILIVLSTRAKVSIILPINPELIKFLKNENNNTVKEYNKLINLNKKNNYVKRNGVNLTNQKQVRELYMNNNVELTNVMANAPNEHNKDWGNYKFINIANTINNHFSKSIKKKVYLRIYITKFGFKSQKQFINMMTFMEKIYFDKKYNFKSELSFKKEDFFKRIKIIKPNETSRNAINIPKNINKSTFVNKHPNLKLLLNYINQEDNKYRENFNIWITGSKYSEAELKLWVYKETFKIRNVPAQYKVSTCSNSVNIYKTDKITGMNNTKMLETLHNTIKNNISKTKFTVA